MSRNKKNQAFKKNVQAVVVNLVHPDLIERVVAVYGETNHATREMIRILKPSIAIDRTNFDLLIQAVKTAGDGCDYTTPIAKQVLLAVAELQTVFNEKDQSGDVYEALIEMFGPCDIQVKNSKPKKNS